MHASARSVPQNPDEDDAEKGGREARHSQRLRRGHGRACGKPFDDLGEQRVRDTLDNQNEGERGQKVPRHSLVALRRRRLLIGEMSRQCDAAGDDAAGDAGDDEEAAPEPALEALLKKRKKLLSGLSTKVVSCPASAVRYASSER